MAAIGIDIGGTKVAVGLVDDSGGVVWETRIPTGAPEPTMAAIIEACRRDPGDVEAVGIGASGPLDLEAGTFAIADNLPGWAGLPIVGILREALGKPVVMENDADAAIAGEVFFGAARRIRDQVVAMLTIGTGVGGAVWTGSGFYRGAFGEHPEIGHMPVVGDGPACYCGGRGCLESVVSGTALAEAYGDARRLFEASDERAVALLGKVESALAAAIICLAHTFRPALIVFGGGVMEAHYERFAQALEAAAARPTQLLKPMRVAKAELGNRAGMIGAAALVLNR